MYWKKVYGESVSQEQLTKILNDLNRTFNHNNKVRDTDRSLFFSGLMIALKDNNFRSIYKNIQAPTKDDLKANSSTVLESHKLNQIILDAITTQLENKINNFSKEYSWRDKFSFIKNIDYPLKDYKYIIEKIECNIFKPFINNEKHDILGKAYRIFLQRAGKVDNKNIILTPDHIKSLMIRLARLGVDDVVLDTCAGTGGFLMEAMNDMVKKANKNDQVITNIKEKQLIGFEVDAVLFSLACTNMFLQGDGKTNMIFRSSIIGDKNEGIVNNAQADLVDYIRQLKPTKCVINPPYEKNSSIRFATQAIQYLEPNGKLVIIMPTPSLIQNQNGLTEKLLEIAKLDFVIRMPYKLFSEQKRTVNTSIFGFTRAPHNKLDEVLYYDLEDDGFVSIQHKGRVDKNNQWDDIMSSIIDTINNSKTYKGICEKKRIYQDEILNCAGIKKKIHEQSKMLKIGDLFDIEDGALASDKSEEGEYDFITGAEDWKKHNQFTYDKKAIVYVIKAGGSLGRSHYVNSKFIASNLCIVLTPSNDKYPINLEFYNQLLNHKRKNMVSDMAEGTSKLTINKNVLLDYYIEYIPIDAQNEFVSKHINKYKVQAEQFKKLMKTAKINISDEFNKMV